MAKKSSISPQRRQELIDAMKVIFGDDTRRIEHSLKVLDYAEQLLAREPGDGEVVVAAAILHDIGIHQAEAKHGSSEGRFQEIEGPPIARGILQKLRFGPATIDHVCRIVANHHSARDIDTPEFRIVWDADWLVNLPAEFPHETHAQLENRVNKIFKTGTGKTLARKLYL